MPFSTLEAKQISELCTVIDCEHKTAPYVKQSEYLVVRTSNVRNGILHMKDMKYTTKGGFEEWTQRAVPEYGDVLFTREAPAGESCLVPRDKNVCMGQRMVMLRPKKEITDSVFLSLILNTDRAKADISRLSIGSTVSRINISDIKKLKVASPPLPEQRKIAKILSTWDSAIATTEKLIANSKQQKKALMQQLLTGKKRLINPETGKAFEGDWSTKNLEDITTYSKGYTYKSSEYSDAKTSNGFLTLKSIGKGGGYSAKGIKYLLTPPNKKFLVNRGDLVFAATDLTRNAEVVGAPILVPLLPYESCFISMDLIKLNVMKTIDKVFLFYLLKLQKNRNFMRARASGSTVLHLDVKGSKKLKLFLPTTLNEQQKIASVLTAADKEIEILESKLAHLKQEKKALMQQLLTGKRRVMV